MLDILSFVCFKCKPEREQAMMPYIYTNLRVCVDNLCNWIMNPNYYLATLCLYTCTCNGNINIFVITSPVNYSICFVTFTTILCLLLHYSN